jgi:hypothetical protein
MCKGTEDMEDAMEEEAVVLEADVDLISGGASSPLLSQYALKMDRGDPPGVQQLPVEMSDTDASSTTATGEQHTLLLLLAVRNDEDAEASSTTCSTGGGDKCRSDVRDIPEDVVASRIVDFLTDFSISEETRSSSCVTESSGGWAAICLVGQCVVRLVDSTEQLLLSDESSASTNNSCWRRNGNVDDRRTFSCGTMLVL